MKILQVNTSDLGGGAEKVAYQLYSGIKDHDHDSNMLVGIKCREDNDIIGINKKFYDKALSKIINTAFSTQGALNFASTKYSKEIVKKHYDIINYHNIHGNYFNISNIDRLSRIIPAVWTLHDMWPLTGRCAYPYNCTEWMKSCGNCGEYLTNYPKMIWDNSTMVLKKKKKYFNNKNISLITPSKWMENMVKKSILKELDIVTIHNGVDLKIYKKHNKIELRRKYGLDPNKKYLIFISVNVDDERKGFKYVKEALNSLDNKEEYTLLIVGNKFDESVLDRKFKIEQFGYISDESKINEIFALADVFLMPTLADNFPCTIIEAMASGTSVISFDIGGIPEQIDERTGFVLPFGDIKGIKDSIISLNNKLFIKEKCEESRIKVEKMFSLDKCINSYLKVYENIIKHNNKIC